MASAQVFREFGVGNSGANGIASACVTMEPISWSIIAPSLVREMKTKMGQRTVEQIVDSGESEGEAQELDDGV